MFRQTFSLLAAVAMALALSAATGNADERPLIWAFSKSGDASYSARVGSRLPTRWSTRAGAELAMAGRDPAAWTKPVWLWAEIDLPGVKGKSFERSARIAARMNATTETRTVSATRVVKRTMRYLDARIDQTIAVDGNPARKRRTTLRASQSVRLTSHATRTSVVVTASRTADNEWHSAIALEQPVRKSLKLDARIDDRGIRQGRARLGARYSHSW